MLFSLDEIRLIASFSEENSTLPQWSHIVFDTHCAYAQSASCGIFRPTAYDFQVAVPAKNLQKACLAVGSTNFQLSLEKNHRLIISAEGGKAQVDGVSLHDFPRLPKPSDSGPWMALPRLARAEVISWARGKDKTRQHLSGYHLCSEGYVEATDGHVYAQIDLESPKPPPDIILPAALLRGLPSPVFLQVEDNRCFLAPEASGKQGYHFGSLIQAKFPSLHNVLLSAAVQPAFQVERLPLIQILKHAKLSQDNVIFNFQNNQLTVEVLRNQKDTGLFDFSASLPVEKVENEPFVSNGRIGFSANFILPALQTANSAWVKIYLSPAKEGGLDPFLLVDPPLKSLAMPYRLQ